MTATNTIMNMSTTEVAYNNNNNRTILPGDLNDLGGFGSNLGHLDSLYKFLRQTEWNRSVLPVTVYVAVLMAVGILGNILVILVYMRKPRAVARPAVGSGLGQSQTLVVWLAVVDLVVCLVAMPGQAVKSWFIPWKHDAICKIWEFFVHTTLPISAVFLVAIAYDRHILLCRPTHIPTACAAHRQLIATLVGAVVLGVCFGIPPALTVGVNQPGSGGREDSYLGLCEVNGITMSEHSLNIYWYVLMSFYLLVLGLLLVMYSAILASVWKHATFTNSRRVSTKPTPPSPSNLTLPPNSNSDPDVLCHAQQPSSSNAAAFPSTSGRTFIWRWWPRRKVRGNITITAALNNIPNTNSANNGGGIFFWKRHRKIDHAIMKDRDDNDIALVSHHTPSVSAGSSSNSLNVLMAANTDETVPTTRYCDKACETSPTLPNGRANTSFLYEDIDDEQEPTQNHPKPQQKSSVGFLNDITDSQTPSIIPPLTIKINASNQSETSENMQRQKVEQNIAPSYQEQNINHPKTQWKTRVGFLTDDAELQSTSVSRNLPETAQMWHQNKVNQDNAANYQEQNHNHSEQQRKASVSFITGNSNVQCVNGNKIVEMSDENNVQKNTVANNPETDQNYQKDLLETVLGTNDPQQLCDSQQLAENTRRLSSNIKTGQQVRFQTTTETQNNDKTNGRLTNTPHFEPQIQQHNPASERPNRSEVTNCATKQNEQLNQTTETKNSVATDHTILQHQRWKSFNTSNTKLGKENYPNTEPRRKSSNTTDTKQDFPNTASRRKSSNTTDTTNTASRRKSSNTTDTKQDFPNTASRRKSSNTTDTTNTASRRKSSNTTDTTNTASRRKSSNTTDTTKTASRRKSSNVTDATQGVQNYPYVMPKPLCRAHIKTAVMFFLVTLTFLASYVPTFLMILDLVPSHPVWYYSYYIHSVINPLLYSAANTQFRTSARRFFVCCNNSK